MIRKDRCDECIVCIIEKKVTLVTKSSEAESNTKYAQGGIAVVLNQIEDTPENIYNLEKALHKTFRDLKYHPILKFRGSTESFLVNKKIIEYEF